MSSRDTLAQHIGSEALAGTIHDLLDDRAAQALLVALLISSRSLGLLLDAVDTTSLAVQLHKCLAGRVLDLEHAASSADAHALLLRETVEGSARLGRDGVVGAPRRALLLLPVGTVRARVNACWATGLVFVRRLLGRALLLGPVCLAAVVLGAARLLVAVGGTSMGLLVQGGN